jgi:hypothetical protein
MDLVTLVVLLIVFGLIIWLVQTYLPIPPPIKTVIVVVLVLILCLWLLRAVGIVGPIIGRPALR